MSINVSVAEITNDFEGVMKRARTEGSATVFRGDLAIAQIIPIENGEFHRDDPGKTDYLKVAEEIMDEYSEMFAKLAKS